MDNGLGRQLAAFLWYNAKTVQVTVNQSAEVRAFQFFFFVVDQCGLAAKIPVVVYANLKRISFTKML